VKLKFLDKYVADVFIIVGYRTPVKIASGTHARGCVT